MTPDIGGLVVVAVFLGLTGLGLYLFFGTGLIPLYVDRTWD